MPVRSVAVELAEPEDRERWPASVRDRYFPLLLVLLASLLLEARSASAFASNSVLLFAPSLSKAVPSVKGTNLSLHQAEKSEPAVSTSSAFACRHLNYLNPAGARSQRGPSDYVFVVQSERLLDCFESVPAIILMPCLQ